MEEGQASSAIAEPARACESAEGFVKGKTSKSPSNVAAEPPAPGQGGSAVTEDEGDDCDDVCSGGGGCEEEEDEQDGGEATAQHSTLAAQLEYDEYPAAEIAVLNDPAPQPRAANPSARYERRRGSVDTDVLVARVESILTWERMLAYIAICGRAAFSAEQYDFFKEAITSAGGRQAATMQPYKTVRRQMRNNLVKWCFPASAIKFVENVERPRGNQNTKGVLVAPRVKKPAQACVRMVLPSEWAKLDVCTYTFYSDVYEHPQRASPQFLSIENAPIVQRRAPFIGREVTLWSLFSGAPCVTKQGDTVDVPCAARPVQVEHGRVVLEEWFRGEKEDEGDTSVRGVFCGSWLIGAASSLGGRSAGSTRPPPGADEWTVHERALQSKFSRPSPNQPAMDAVLEGAEERAHDREPLASSMAAQTHLAYSTNVVQLFPGDQCVLLRAESNDVMVRGGHSGYVEPVVTQHCVLIGSIVKQAQGFPGERLVWMDISERGEGRATMRYVGTSNVTNLPTWVKGKAGTPHTEYIPGTPRDTGFMQNGSRYVVYRFAIYMDGFKQTKGQRDKRSVGGCYLLPLGLSLEGRRGTGAPRVLTLASCAVGHNKVMQMLMDDISRAASEGVDGYDPYGRRVRIFLDPVTFFGDYPAAALCADVYGHTGNAYCTHCTVVRRDAANGSSILCTPMNNSRRVGYMRTDARIRSIRESPLHPNVYKKIGMKSQDEESSVDLPLVRLSDMLRRATRPETDSRGEEIAPLMFESSQSCAAVPDHLFNGLIKNMLKASFKKLGNDSRRAAVEKRMAGSARDNGLPVTGYILNWAKDGTYKGINNHTMTTLMCLLLCAAPAFDTEYGRTGSRVFRLARLLHDFASAVYFWPYPGTDGEARADMFRTEGRIKYYADLREMATQYLAECDKVMEEDEETGAILDKPNAHRAVELAIHTIPTFGHARNCSEMVLEGMHQVFKGWLEKNTHQDSHLSAVERALARDWTGRVFALFKIWEGGTSRERACSELGLRRLLLGEEGMHLDERQAGVTEFKDMFHGAMRDAFREPIASMMGRSGHLSLPRARRVKWQVHETESLQPAVWDSLGPIFKKGTTLLGGHYNLRSGFESRSMSVFRAARLVHSDVYEGRRKTYKYNEIEKDCVVSCATAPAGWFVRADDIGGSSMRFYAVVAVVRGPDMKLWAITMPMASTGTDDGEGMRVEADGCTVVELADGVRRAGAAHVCDDACVPHRRGLQVKHSARVCDGGLYETWTREQGYPPHMG